MISGMIVIPLVEIEIERYRKFVATEDVYKPRKARDLSVYPKLMALVSRTRFEVNDRNRNQSSVGKTVSAFCSGVATIPRHRFVSTM